MNEKVLRVLEFYKIRDRLVNLASSEPGKKKCAALIPSCSLEEINHAQQETEDALSRIFKKGNLSFGGLREIRPLAQSLAVGAVLSAADLLQIASLLECAGRVKSYGRKERDDQASDSLTGLFQSLEALTSLSGEIRRCILSEDEIADDASSNLKHIRRSILLTNDKIHSQLNSLLNGSYRTYLQDAVITMRNNRYCLPVKAEYKGQVPGMVHDQSSTGSTFFIEPAAIVNLNNQLKELAMKEQEEIETILAILIY